MNNDLLIDTDVIIDYLKDQSQAVTYIEGLDVELLISSITVAELFAGVRDNEKKKLVEFISVFRLIPVSYDIALKGGLFRRSYLKSHGVGLADAIIAASAELENATLVTLNRKHFPMLEDVYVPYLKE